MFVKKTLKTGVNMKQLRDLSSLILNSETISGESVDCTVMANLSCPNGLNVIKLKSKSDLKVHLITFHRDNLEDNLQVLVSISQR